MELNQPTPYRRVSQKASSPVDANRVREIVSTAVGYIQELLQYPDFGTSLQSSEAILEQVLKSGAAPKSLVLPMYNTSVNDLQLVLDLQKRKISAVSQRNPNKRATINAVLRTLSYG
jgi:hypothetical protein